MRIDIATLFPELCRTVLMTSMTGIAAEKGIADFRFHQLRDYTANRQKQTEDRPFGGGPGKLLTAQPVADCCRAVMADCAASGLPGPHIVFLTAAGKPYTQEDAKRLSAYPSLLLVCGHYEGIDERAAEVFADEELSIGDYVLTGGEIPALAVADSIVRLLPGVLREEQSITEESYWNGLLEYPQYTRPACWEGHRVPEVLLSGDHQRIAAWRKQQQEERTRLRRPELYEKYERESEPGGRKVKKHIVCIGDSNTHGYCADPADQAEGGSRFNEEERFPCLLQKLLGEDCLVTEEGLSGRTTVFDDPLTEGLSALSAVTPILLSHEPVDLAVIMLGTNDTKERFGCTAECIGVGIRRLLRKALETECWGKNGPRVLFVCPPPMLSCMPDGALAGTMGKGCVEKSLELPFYARQAAEGLGCGYLDAAGCEFNTVDGMHLTAKGHRQLAERLAEKIREMEKPR